LKIEEMWQLWEPWSHANKQNLPQLQEKIVLNINKPSHFSLSDGSIFIMNHHKYWVNVCVKTIKFQESHIKLLLNDIWKEIINLEKL